LLLFKLAQPRLFRPALRFTFHCEVLLFGLESRLFGFVLCRSSSLFLSAMPRGLFSPTCFFRLALHLTLSYQPSLFLGETPRRFFSLTPLLRLASRFTLGYQPRLFLHSAARQSCVVLCRSSSCFLDATPSGLLLLALSYGTVPLLSPTYRLGAALNLPLSRYSRLISAAQLFVLPLRFALARKVILSAAATYPHRGRHDRSSDGKTSSDDDEKRLHDY
jgi:hypothetical protein